MSSQDSWREVSNALALSAQELELVRRVSDGLTELAIARLLNSSPYTVHTVRKPAPQAGQLTE